MIPSIVLLGNLLVDDVVFADGTTRIGQAGGALLYGALGATVWESRPGLVSVLGDDYPAQVLEKLEQRGADLTGIHALGRSGVRTWLLYEGQVRRLIHRLGCPTHEEVSPGPALIPSEWTGARAFHTPLIAGWSIWIATAISTRVNDVRVAQQLSALASLPSIAVTTLIAFNVIEASAATAVIAGAALLVLNGIGWLVTSALVDRERLVAG